MVRIARKQLDTLSRYHELGSHRATAALCGMIRRVVERRGHPPTERLARPTTTDPVLEFIAERVRASDGRINAKRVQQALYDPPTLFSRCHGRALEESRCGEVAHPEANLDRGMAEADESVAPTGAHRADEDEPT